MNPAENKLSVCMIVRDEEALIARALESVTGVGDEIVVVDTGSSDATMDIARSFGARVVQHSWNGNFAEARNRALDSAEGRWVLFIDADEYLEPESKPAVDAAVARGADAYLVRIESDMRSAAGRTYVNLLHRLFMNRADIRYEGAVHEQIDSSLKRIGAKVEMSGIVLKHSGYALDPSRMRAKLERNLDILRKETARFPDDGVCLFHLGETLAMLGNHEEAAAAYTKAVGGRGLPAELKPVAEQNLASAMIRTGRYEEAMRTLRRVLEMDPGMLSAHLLIGSALFALKKYKRAEQEIVTYISMAREKRKPAVRFMGFEADIPAAMVLIAKCRLADGGIKSAEEVLREAVALDPGLADGHILLGRIAFERTEFAGAAKYFARAAELLPHEERLRFELARSLMGAGAVDRARDTIERAIGDGLESAGLLRCLGLVSIKLRDFEAAVAAYERSLEAEPGNAEAHRMLAGLYHKLGDDAAAERHLTICN
jgi:tetratricopeptide (TPR) repeat protein